jgi:uncharacterized DUF497 family protein
MTLLFEWDKTKSRQNKKKHGISFEEAETVFADDAARLIHDPDHSAEEDRFLLLGMSRKTRLLVVVHCYRGNDGLIRVISARKATGKEETTYMEFNYEK